jgi:hypothetical protein
LGGQVGELGRRDFVARGVFGQRIKALRANFFAMKSLLDAREENRIIRQMDAKHSST